MPLLYIKNVSTKITENASKVTALKSGSKQVADGAKSLDTGLGALSAGAEKDFNWSLSISNRNFTACNRSNKS